MKRILPLFMLLVILALVSGCTNSAPTPTPTPEPIATEVPAPVETATPEPTVEPTLEPSSAPAAADAVPTTISVEGTEATIEVVTFESKHGYSIQYDVNSFAPETSKDQAQDVFWPTNADAVKGVSLTIRVRNESDYTLLNAEADLREALQMERYTISTTDVPAAFSSYNTVALRATKDNLIANCYLIATDSGIYTLQLSYPTEAAEGYGARLMAMAETFVPAKAK